MYGTVSKRALLQTVPHLKQSRKRNPQNCLRMRSRSTYPATVMELNRNVGSTA
jgi:hypothetical protein